MLTEAELLKKKKEITEAKQELAELKGEEKALLKNLESKYDIHSLEEAKELLEQKTVEIEKKEIELQTFLEKLEEKYF